MIKNTVKVYSKENKNIKKEIIKITVTKSMGAKQERGGEGRKRRGHERLV